MISKTALRCAVAAVLLAAVAVAATLGAGREAARASSPDERASVSALGTTPTPALRSARAAATWCGSPSEVDAKPNVVAGNPVHWVYVLAADGQDRFANFASVMQTDAEAIDGWWRSQDPVRAPRSDLAPFSCGSQLDLSTVRLAQTGSQLSASRTPFEPIWTSLTSRGLGARHTKYVVYYDGPVGDQDLCGSGATFPGGLGMAMVYVQSCAGISTAQVAAHELLHAMGAVPDGAPHMCAPPDEAHTCDNNRDLMYPFTDGTPLGGLTLDPGRDDYYGHSGAWADLQDSPWLVQLDRQAPLALTITGPGKVEADLPGLECTQSCSTTWNADTRLVLTPTPGAGAKLVRWSGACAGAFQCQLTVAAGSAASALFAPLTYRLGVRVSGRGTVRSSSGAVACPGRCSAAVPSHTPLRLTAKPAKGWKLKTWAGACRGNRLTCTLPMTASASARAVFVRT